MPSLATHPHQNILLMAVALGLGVARVEAKGMTCLYCTALVWFNLELNGSSSSCL